ncbi:hypothetical protein MXB_4142, partial [Myxobolus squamalis]
QESIQRLRRRSRTCFTKKQLDELEAAFTSSQYPDNHLKQRLVSTLSMDEHIIGIWFKNRRAKLRRNQKGSSNEVDLRLYGYPVYQEVFNGVAHPTSPRRMNSMDPYRYPPIGYYSSNCLSRGMPGNNYTNIPHMYPTYENCSFNQSNRPFSAAQYMVYNPSLDSLNQINPIPNYQIAYTASYSSNSSSNNQFNSNAIPTPIPNPNCPQYQKEDRGNVNYQIGVKEGNNQDKENQKK